MNRAELVTRLNIVSRALAQNNLVPVFQCLAFTGDKVMAFDDSLAIVAPCATHQSLVVDGKVLMGLLNNCTSEEVEFVTKKGEDMTIKAGKSKFKLPWQTIDEYLFTDPEDVQPLMVLDITDEIRGALKACLTMASDDLARPAWMGVCVKGNDKRITMYSTDGDAVARYTADKQPHPLDESFLMPSAFCDHLLRTFVDTEAKTGKLELGSEWVKATLDTSYVLYGRLLEVDEPIDYEDMIKQSIKGKPQYVDIPADFDMALSRARVVSDPVTAYTVLTVEDKKLGLCTQTPLGEVRDTLTITNHKDVEAHVSAELVQRCAKLTSGMHILPNCCVFTDGKLLILVSNMD